MFKYASAFALTALTFGLEISGAHAAPPTIAARCDSVLGSTFSLAHPEQTIYYPEGHPEKAKNAKVSGLYLPWSCNDSDTVKLISVQSNGGKTLVKLENNRHPDKNLMILMPDADLDIFFKSIVSNEKDADHNSEVQERIKKEQAGLDAFNPKVQAIMKDKRGEIVASMPDHGSLYRMFFGAPNIDGHKASGTYYSLRSDGFFDISDISEGYNLPSSFFFFDSPTTGYNNVVLVKSAVPDRPDLTLVYVRGRCENVLLPSFRPGNDDNDACIIWATVAPTKDVPIFLPTLQQRVGMAQTIITQLAHDEAIEEKKAAKNEAERKRLEDEARSQAMAIKSE